MIKLKEHDKFQIQYLLPVQGSISTLEIVQGILDKLNIKPEDELSENICEIDLNNTEISFLQEMIKVLDLSHKLNLSGLSVIKQILNIKETI